MKVYLAGPDVFLPNTVEVGKEKVKILQSYNLEGLFPLDTTIDPHEDNASMFIYQNCISLLEESDIVIANLTPFRGVSADVGTVFELGYAVAMNKPIYAYSYNGNTYESRYVYENYDTVKYVDGIWYDGDGNMIEHFKHFDNLM